MKRAVLLFLLLGLGASCTSHPCRVTDLDSGRVYYTKEMRRGLASGKVYLKDAKTGAKVTVASSSVERIAPEEFDRAVAAK